VDIAPHGRLKLFSIQGFTSIKSVNFDCSSFS
jgi:hypothetical protein